MKNKYTLFIVATMAWFSSCTTVQQTPSPDFIISTAGSGENSVAAMPPAPGSNHGGTFALNRGVAWHTTTGFCIFKNIYQNGAVTNTNSVIAGFTANSTPGEINEALDSLSSSTDNQMVCMDDGSLLLEKNCFYWKKNPAITWMADSMDYHHPGDRSANVFWRSTDSGKSWKLYSVLDPVNFGGGLYCIPGLNKTTGLYHHGGSDRPELYFCPFKKRVYLTSDYGGVAEPTTPILLYSDDHAKTWQEVGPLTGNTPQMMTSTGDGRLFTFGFWHDHQGLSMSYTKEVNGKPVLVGPFNVGYTDAQGNIIPSGTKSKPLLIDWNTTSLAVSRVTVDPTQVYDVVRIAYMAYNSDSTRDYNVADVFVNKETGNIFEIPITIIKAADPVNYQVTFGTFIDPDFIDLPSASGENTSVFYWIEQSVPGATTQPQVMAKYCVFTDGVDYTAPLYLSLNAQNQNYAWNQSSGEGDYLKGGFFWNNSNLLNYMCDWNEPDGIHANIVSIKSDYSELTFVKSGANVSAYPQVNWNDFKPKNMRR
jgi:hypothetical protein